jgi:hypothetical protein
MTNPTRGYIILAQNSRKEDYVKMAYALALSIKNTQSTVNNVCLATDRPTSAITSDLRQVFDDIVPIPWTDNAADSKWKIENKWKYFHMTPYDETVILDADMLFPADISHWWDVLSTKEVWITDKPRTFKGEIITSTKYRNTFLSNELPNVYTAFMYFKKTKMSAELFKMTEYIFQNWQTFFYEYLDENRPKNLSGDVAFALAIKILGITEEVFGNSVDLPSFVHMKGHLQNIGEKFITEDWTKHIPTYFKDDGSFKIGNYEQTLPFHYHVKDWLTLDIITKLEKAVGIE